MKCTRCGIDVPEKRVEFLQKAGRVITCLAHSSEQRVAGFMSWEHKTAPALNIVSQETAMQVYKDTYRKGQSVIAGARMKGH